MLTLLLTILTAQADDLYKKYEWEVEPVIEICPESNVTIEEVEEAMEYWYEEVNFTYKTIRKVKNCAYQKENVIQVSDGAKVNFDKKELANTAVYTYKYSDSNQKFIDYALVSIPNNPAYPNKQQILITHEIGHAIGYGHSHHDIMRPSPLH